MPAQAGPPAAQFALVGDFNIAPLDEDVWDIDFFRENQMTHVTEPERAAFRAFLKTKNPLSCRSLESGFRGSDRRRSGDLTIFSRTLYQLSYRARHTLRYATTASSHK